MFLILPSIDVSFHRGSFPVANIFSGSGVGKVVLHQILSWCIEGWGSRAHYGNNQRCLNAQSFANWRVLNLDGVEYMLNDWHNREAVLLASVEEMHKAFSLTFALLLWACYDNTNMPAPTPFAKELRHLLPVVPQQIFHRPVHDNRACFLVKLSKSVLFCLFLINRTK